MKGIVFNLLEEVVSREYSEDVWDDLLTRAELTGAYTSLGNYSDEEMTALVNAAASALSKTPAEVLIWFGRAAMAQLSVKYPQFFEPHSSSRPFILSVNRIIHPEVRKLYSGAACPYFHFQEDADSLSMAYRSPRKLCHLAEGFVYGAAAHYGDRVTFDHVTCMHHGDAACHFNIRWQIKSELVCTAA